MSPAEEYAIALQNPEPSHYTRIPNILDHLTYDSIDEKTGKHIIKRLSVYAKELYRVLKSVAGEGGACWRTRDHLAELCNMSAGMITSAKKELQQKFHQLNGNQLIILDKRKKTTEKNKTEYDCITIVDIWRWNRAFMCTLKYQKKGARSEDDRGGEAPSCGDSQPQGAPSRGDTNNNTDNKNPLLREQQPASLSVSVEQPVCSLEKESPVPLEETDSKATICNRLLKIGFDLKDAVYLSQNQKLQDLENARAYCIQREKEKKAKGEKFNNPVGYFKTVLKNRYWEKKHE